VPDSPAEELIRASLGEIIFILLQHFHDALVEAGLSPGAGEARELAEAIAAGQRHIKTEAVLRTIADMVDAYLAGLQSRWQINFAASLGADMAAIGPWRTTAEFLELANDKAEAETGIALGSALLVAAGRREYAPFLLDVLDNDAGAFDIDATIARRILLHVSGVDGSRADWRAQLQRWLDDQPPDGTDA